MSQNLLRRTVKFRDRSLRFVQSQPFTQHSYRICLINNILNDCGYMQKVRTCSSFLSTFSFCFVVLSEPIWRPHKAKHLSAANCSLWGVAICCTHKLLVAHRQSQCSSDLLFVSSQEHWSREAWVLVLLDRENHSAQQVNLWYICQRCFSRRYECLCERACCFSGFEAFSQGV